MSLRARVASWTFLTALLAATALTALNACDGERASHAALVAEGRRIAFSAVTLYDVLRLTGSEADKATLQAFLRAAVKGTSTEEQLAYALVLDERDSIVAGELNEALLGNTPSRDASGPLGFAGIIKGTSILPHIVAIEARVVARDADAQAEDAPAGRVLVGLSNRPARAALQRSLVVSGALAALVASAFAGALFVFLGRRVMQPVSRVVKGMAELREGKLDVVVADPGGSDEAARLSRGFNELVTSLMEKDKLRTTLERHVGKKLADDVADLPVGSGRRVAVTALFLDVESFGSRMSRTPPEEIVAFLHELVGACVDVVHAHDGHVVKLMGDTLLALWGAPLARPDDAVCATRAALALQERCQALSDAQRARGGEPFTVGVGVATGEAVIATVGNAERAETIVVGEVIMQARRIEEQAKQLGFGVLVSSETFGRIEKLFEGAATPPILVKGIGEPLILFRVRPRRDRRA